MDFIVNSIVTSKHISLQFFQVQLLLFMEPWKQQERLISTKVYYKSGQNYITNWGIFITNWGKCYYKLGQLRFIRQALCKLGQLHFIINCDSFKIGASIITNWGSLIITNRGKFYNKPGQLLQIRATVITNWGSYYKFGQTLLQIRAAITNWGITRMQSSLCFTVYLIAFLFIWSVTKFWCLI